MNPAHKRRLKDFVAIPLGVVVAYIGVQHFVRPEPFDVIVPDYLGWPRFWTLASGALEVLLGLGMCLSMSRAIASRLFFYLVILMSLANFNMWWNDLPFDGTRLTQTGHFIRLCVQVVLLLTLYWLSKDSKAIAPSRD